MTYLEVLLQKSKGDNVEELRALLVEQGVDPDAKYQPQTKGFDLAYAWFLVGIISSPNWSQGDMSESWDRDSLVRIASNIFNKYSEENPLQEKSIIIDASNRW